ncbi:hypothetical protein J4457_02925, partial [Candidatus Woesearchaeota archaeon]|nr:hypothetical protein [Candidatus Woesearchaeota archaeon]
MVFRKESLAEYREKRGKGYADLSDALVRLSSNLGMNDVDSTQLEGTLTAIEQGRQEPSHRLLVLLYGLTYKEGISINFEKASGNGIAEGAVRFCPEALKWYRHQTWQPKEELAKRVCQSSINYGSTRYSVGCIRRMLIKLEMGSILPPRGCGTELGYSCQDRLCHSIVSRSAVSILSGFFC